MKKYKETLSLGLGTVYKEFANLNVFDNALNISESEHVALPKLLNQSHELQYTAITIYWTCLIVGSYFRFILYRYLFQQYKEKSVKTIDRLILVIALVPHLHILISAIDITLKVFDISSQFESALGHGACRIKTYYYKFVVIYGSIGSLGLASYRLLYIKKGTFVQEIVGEKTLANIILFLGLGLSAGLILFPRIVPQTWSHLEWEPCLNAPQLVHALEFLDDYAQTLELSSPLAAMKRTYQGTLMLNLLLTFVEMCLYISFFHYMYKHDNGERLARLLEPATIHQRNKQNAITFFGQFCSFVLELMGDILLIIAIAKSAPTEKDEGTDMYVLAFISQPAKFTAISIVEVVTSSVLRRRILNPTI